MLPMCHPVKNYTKNITKSTSHKQEQPLLVSGTRPRSTSSVTVTIPRPMVTTATS